MNSAESLPSWDFTAVIGLLHTPTYTSSSPDRRRDTLGDPSPNGPDNDAGDGRGYAAAKHRRLGDFGCLWDLLKQPPSPPSPPSPETPSTVETKQAAHQTPAKKFTILKRPNTPRADPKYVGHDGLLGTISDTSAEVDSDGDLSVFDPPASQKQGVSIPFQASKATGAVDPLLSPLSSYDEMESIRSFASDNRRKKTESILANTSANKPPVEKRARLINKLLRDFPDCTGIISRHQDSLGARYSPDSSTQIHVFVDASNIMIGFHNCFKSSRKIPIATRIRLLSLSFYNLSIILERGRRATKRVLVGSDRIPAINEAERIGYETNILDRVQKAKQRSPRRPKVRNANSIGAHGWSSGSDSHPPEERWVEQGVDEILHLKILESLVDTKTPTTIVLATGDAAEAEYSGGFLKMVERALQKGWTVEVVSFSINTSSAYKKKGFRSKWGSQFKVIELDNYIEELLDT